MKSNFSKLRIKPSKTPLLFSYENLVLFVFLILTINFGVFFRIGIFEIIIVVFLVIVIILPVLGKLFKLSKINYVISKDSISQESKWSPKWNFTIKKEEIKHIQLRQNLLQKFLDVGDLIVTSSNKSRQYRFANIGNFSKQKYKIEQILDQSDQA